MGRRLNHSRHMDFYARDVGDREYEKAKATPTVKQIRFYKKLCYMCKVHNTEPKIGPSPSTRADYAWAIDKLIEHLRGKGVDIQGNGKKATRTLIVGEDHWGRLTTRERIQIEDGEE